MQCVAKNGAQFRERLPQRLLRVALTAIGPQQQASSDRRIGSGDRRTRHASNASTLRRPASSGPESPLSWSEPRVTRLDHGSAQMIAEWTFDVPKTTENRAGRKMLRYCNPDR